MNSFIFSSPRSHIWKGLISLRRSHLLPRLNVLPTNYRSVYFATCYTIRNYCKATDDFPKQLKTLPEQLKAFVEKEMWTMKPDSVYLCDGSIEESEYIKDICVKAGVMKRLPKYENCWLTLTDPADVARVEGKTFICTAQERDAVTVPRHGRKSSTGNWMSLQQLEKECSDRFPGCMKGRTMYVVPFSMGPIGSPYSKIGVQLTDSPYVVASMRIMTRMGVDAYNSVKDGAHFVKCIHSVGQPLPAEKPFVNNWPCNPSKVMIAHVPSTDSILSFGSGYGGNSLLGKKCFALRLGGILAQRENWLAEHMLILGVTNPEGRKKYIAAAFPSACGKTNLAMMMPALKGYKVECVGDDIAWMRFGNDGKLRAINPENGFFGVAPGTSMSTNPNAMKAIQRNTVFTNVAETSDGGFYWAGLEKEVDLDNTKITSWRGEPWHRGDEEAAAHPNSRFATPASQCPIIDSHWEDAQGVVIEAILFGGKRPQGVPLVYEARNWEHGVLIGAGLRSEATAAAEHSAGKVIMHDPFAMRPFFGYNFGKYLRHWLNFGLPGSNRQLPRIFHINWFRRDGAGNLLWPGFGENIRVLDWIFRRLDGVEGITEESVIGYTPKADAININGLETYQHLDMTQLMSVPAEFWREEIAIIENYLIDEVNEDLPVEIMEQIFDAKRRLQ